jgi:hypothetical protein
MDGALSRHVGTLPAEPEAKRRIRFHQGWWRAFVLGAAEGRNPAAQDRNVCNTIVGGEKSGENFLTDATCEAVRQTIADRDWRSAGLLNQDRLFNNLLSSQPLAFNFFGELQHNLALAKQVFDAVIPGLEAVDAVMFEYAPVEKYTGDNSAFDVALEIRVGGRLGLLGLECKYTDSFSPKQYDTERYRSIFDASAAFTDPYPEYTTSQFNQLFRNQLIAEALLQNGRYAFCLTGLFCFEGDRGAIQTGEEFQAKLQDGAERFKLIRYKDFIAMAQRQRLSWPQREWTMMLWARYCALQLSEPAWQERAVQAKADATSA